MQKKIIKKDFSSFPEKPNLVDYEKTYKNFSWEKAEKEMMDFFPDGKMNAAYNIIDRHAKGKKKNKIALIFNAANGERETYTFADMARETNKFANVLSSLGVKKEIEYFFFFQQFLSGILHS